MQASTDSVYLRGGQEVTLLKPFTPRVHLSAWGKGENKITMDEKEANVQWIEAAWENLEEALSQRNWSLAHAVIEDTREGYSDLEANKMMKRLYQAQSQEEVKEMPVYTPLTAETFAWYEATSLREQEDSYNRE